jgi:hypothetical protein
MNYIIISSGKLLLVLASTVVLVIDPVDKAQKTLCQIFFITACVFVARVYLVAILRGTHRHKLKTQLRGLSP